MRTSQATIANENDQFQAGLSERERLTSETPMRWRCPGGGWLGAARDVGRRGWDLSDPSDYPGFSVAVT